MVLIWTKNDIDILVTVNMMLIDYTSPANASWKRKSQHGKNRRIREEETIIN